MKEEMIIVLYVVVATLVLTAYLVPALYTARHFYGRRRATSIDYWHGWYSEKSDTDPVDRFNKNYRTTVMANSAALGLVWPLVWLVVGPYMTLMWVGRMLFRFMESTDWQSSFEAESEAVVEQFEKITREAAGEK